MAKNVANNGGLSPAGKVGIILAVFGVPCLFALSSWGLLRIYEMAPLLLILVLVIFATVYTAQTTRLLYKFYDADVPVYSYVPCICEVSLMDVKYHFPCFVLYVLSIIFLALSQLPYSLLKVFGEGFALSAGFRLAVIGLVFLLAVQVLKGIAIYRTVKDVAEDWTKHMHSTPGIITKFALLSFIPFVRVIALYSLNKPLSTLVSFMGVSVEDAVGETDFVEEDS